MKLPKRVSAIFLALTMTALTAGTATAQQGSTGQYIDDAVITTKVKAAILEDPTLKVAEINVETSKGVVQLSGFVKSPDSISKAAEVARKVEGVKSVKNDMQLK